MAFFNYVNENRRDPLARLHFWVFLPFGASLHWSSVVDPRCRGGGALWGWSGVLGGGSVKERYKVGIHSLLYPNSITSLSINTERQRKGSVFFIPRILIDRG